MHASTRAARSRTPVGDPMRVRSARSGGEAAGGEERGGGQQRGDQQAGLEREQLRVGVVGRRARPPRPGGGPPPRAASRTCVGRDEAHAALEPHADLLLRRPPRSAGWPRRSVENDAARPLITIAPISAVPSEAPSCCAVYWRPPASLRSSSPTADCTTLPSWETISPMPTPSTAIAIANGVVSISGSIVAEQQQRRDARAARRRRGRSCAATKRCDEPRAEQRGHEQRHRHRQHPQPGLEGVEALHDLQVQRDREEDRP